MKILLYKDLVYKIVFKKIKISINDESSAFLSNSSDLKISFLTNLKLLSKFNMCYWDEIGNTNCLKFLVKYSSIFSKFIEPEELNEVEFEQIEKIEPISHYIEIDGEKFFNINLENCKYIGGNSTGDFSICYIFSYEKENALFENF